MAVHAWWPYAVRRATSDFFVAPFSFKTKNLGKVRSRNQLTRFRSPGFAVTREVGCSSKSLWEGARKMPGFERYLINWQNMDLKFSLKVKRFDSEILKCGTLELGSEELPNYARPLFLRILSNMELTGTFKHQKAPLGESGLERTWPTFLGSWKQRFWNLGLFWVHKKFKWQVQLRNDGFDPAKVQTLSCMFVCSVWQ